MSEKLNLNSFNGTVTEINALLDYLDVSLRHASHMVGSFMSFNCDDNDNITTDMSLNFEALDELVFQSKKISSKADALQNKVSELKKLVNR